MESSFLVLLQNNYFAPEHDGVVYLFYYRIITLPQSMMESRLFVLLQNNYFDSEHDGVVYLFLLQNNYFDPEHDGEQFICFITEQLL